MFHGSQRQPEIKTVEGSLMQALRRLTWWGDGCLEMSSRTDAGVSARFNLARIDIPTSVSKQAASESIVRVLNDHLPVGMVALKITKALPSCRVRDAEFRQYLYRLEVAEDWPEGAMPEAVESACSLFVGTHDFTNLSRPDDSDPIRTVDLCVPWFSDDGRPIGFIIQARSFIWNQVRRIASAISGIASGRLEITDVENALKNPDKNIDLGRAPAQGLILWHIGHPEFGGIIPECLPDSNHLSKRTGELREYRRWLAMSDYQIASILEREWLIRLN
tara:strand:- start:519 stop:1346 length:828 start_codon:yes stop_codon:yes gene_type:complete